MSKLISVQVILLSMIKGDLWLTEGTYSRPHNLFENAATKGSIVIWLYAPDSGISSFEDVITGDQGLFQPPGPQRVQYTINGEEMNGFFAIVGDPMVDPGPYALLVNSKLWDPKIRVISTDGQHKKKRTRSALASA